VEALRAEADAHAIPLGAAALQFPLGSALVSSVIPGPRSKAELEQIVAWFETPIPTAFWASLKEKGLMGEDVPVPAGAS
ncbi:MAG: aldo/keto reductase, partial [Pseudomonadota bacterium]